MEINLMEAAKKIPGIRPEYLMVRENAKRLYEEILENRLQNDRQAQRRVVIDCTGITSASSSFLDQLLFVDIFSENYRHGNSVLVLKQMDDELYFNLSLAVEGKKGLIETAKKEKKYFLTKSHFECYRRQHKDEDLQGCQIGSPYLLCEHHSELKGLGFAEGEKQKILLDDMIKNRVRYTTGKLAAQAGISGTAASNRLTRLFEKNLIFRRMIPDTIPETYEYFYEEE